MTSNLKIGTTAVVSIGDKSFPATVTSVSESLYSVMVLGTNGWSGTFWWSKSAGAYKAGSLYSLTLNPGAN